MAPKYGYPSLCKRRNRRAEPDCAPPPYEFPPVYSELTDLPTYGGLYESWEESQKIAELLTDGTTETFHSVFFETSEFYCDISVSKGTVTVNCVDPRKPGSVSQDYNCMWAQYQNQRGTLKIFGDDIATGKKVLEGYKFHTPPAFCPPPNALMDYHDNIVAKMDFVYSEASGRVMVPLLLNQKEGQPNVLLSTAVHQALLMREKTKYYFDDEYFTVWFDSNYRPIDSHAGYRAGESCLQLSNTSIKEVFFPGISRLPPQLKIQYADMLKDVKTRNLGTAIEDYLIILRKNLLPWIAYEFVAFLITEHHPVTELVEGCDSYDKGFQKTIKRRDITSTEAQLIARHLKSGTRAEQYSTISSFQSRKCKWTANVYHGEPDLPNRFKMNCEDPRAPGTGPSMEYNCLYSHFGSKGKIFNLIGSAETTMKYGNNMGEKIVAKFRSEKTTLPDLCPPAKDLIKFHEAIGRAMGGNQWSYGRDSSVTNLLSGRRPGQPNVVIDVNLYNLLFNFGNYEYATQAFGYREFKDDTPNGKKNKMIETACREIAEFQLINLFTENKMQQLSSSEFQFLYQDVSARGYISSVTMNGISLSDYVNILNTESRSEAMIDFFGYIEKPNSKIYSLMTTCTLGSDVRKYFG